MSDYLDLNNEELLKDFFAEAEQQVENLESNILVIENDPTNHEAVDEIFRAAHTLKGGSATVEMTELSGFTHAVEDLLDELRSGTVDITGDVVDILLSSIDIIKEMLNCRQNGTVYEDDVSSIKEKLASFIPEKGDKKKSKSSVPQNLRPATEQVVQNPIPTEVTSSTDEIVIEPPASLISEYDVLELKELCEGAQRLWGVTVLFDESNPMNSVGGIQVFASLKEKGSVLKTIPDFDTLYEDEFQPRVVYFVASEATQDELEDAAFLDDVSLCADAQLIKSAIAPTVTSAPVKESSELEVKSESQVKQEIPQVEKVPEVAPVQTEVVEPVQEEKTEVSQEKLPAKKVPEKKPTNAANTGSVLRVDSKRIDYLLNLISETVITKAAFNQTAIQLAHMQNHLQSTESAYKEKVRRLIDSMPEFVDSLKNGATIKDIKSEINEEFGDIYTMFDTFDSDFKSMAGKFRSSTQNLGRIAGELQEGVMKIRMVPINQIFSRFPRVVRDLCKDLNKKVNLVIEGEDTELDKSVVEDLLDPIMHCVRNSLDHGIENPSDRLKNGKNDEGTLLLKASNEGNMIVIDIVDDGRGIDVNKVKNKAIERGIIHPNKVLSDQEAYQLIFEPGFSTADKISSVSGRGVGLDVVKTQIEKLKGSVIVTSEHNKGTKFSIRLPLTLAIIQGLLIRVGKEIYSIPIASVIESHRVKHSEIRTIDNYEVLNVRDEVISILRLNRLFGIKTESNEDDVSFVVIVGSADKKIGVMVDALIGEEDVVIKPLHDQYTITPGIAGASILGDGSVSLIIDVSQLLDLGVKQELNAREEREAAINK
ncbi:MAG: chemotaxis protein CheA [Treponemataceae bacterium]|nr:chemotaxis protein CheA [Treponemataceae bacterium]